MNYSASTVIASTPEIQITKSNRQQLGQLLADHAPIRSWRAVEFLVRELMRAAVVDDVSAPDDVVTMRSRVSFQEEGCETIEIVTLTYPGESDMYEDAMSVLTPLGAALLGLSEGQSISYPRPHGGTKTITVITVLDQPEAARQFKPTSRVNRSPDAM
jgi:regulator of nucleoside diphosphate kinase